MARMFRETMSENPDHLWSSDEFSPNIRMLRMHEQQQFTEPRKEDGRKEHQVEKAKKSRSRSDLDTASSSRGGQGIPIVVVSPQDSVRDTAKKDAGGGFGDQSKAEEKLDIEQLGDSNDNDCMTDDEVSEFMWRRRRHVRPGSEHKRRRRSAGNSLRKVECEGVNDRRRPADNKSSEMAIFENIKMQKEVIASIRLQPWKMRKKLRALRNAKTYVEKYEGKLSKSHDYQQKGAKVWRRLKREFENLIIVFIPWEMRIKQIESHFGSVVASYFVFLRWMLWINIWLSLLPVCFIIIPEMITGKPYGSEERKKVPTGEEAKAGNLNNLWNAEGYLKYSVMFYGYYGNDEVIGNGYRLPLAYLLTAFAAYAFSFMVVLKKMAANLKRSKLSFKDDEFTFSWKLFSSWDYMIGNSETANNKYAAIITTFKESIIEEKEKVKEENKYFLLFLRILANVLVVILLAVSAFITYKCVMRSKANETRSAGHEANFWEQNELTIVMIIIFMVFPNFFDLISLMEKYHPRTLLRWQLARVFVLNLLNLFTLLLALYNIQQKSSKPAESLLNSTTDSYPNVSSLCRAMFTVGGNSTSARDISFATVASNTFANVSAATKEKPNLTAISSPQETVSWFPDCKLPHTAGPSRADRRDCWETAIGQELFKLTVMDFILTVCQILIFDFIRGLFVRYCNQCWFWDLEKKFPEYPDFKTTENILHLVNNQGMIWLGTFFAPGLPLLNLFKLILLVYIRCWSVMVCNVPQERMFRASRSNNFYYALLLVMLFLCIVPAGYAIFVLKPSSDCGPFSQSEHMYSILNEQLPSNVRKILKNATSPITLIPVFLLFGMTVYYLLSVSRSLKGANNDLKLKLEYGASWRPHVRQFVELTTRHPAARPRLADNHLLLQPVWTGVERTEGKRKVYAMADAKTKLDKDSPENDVGAGTREMMSDLPGGRKLGDAASSVMAATRMAKQMSSSDVTRRCKVRPEPKATPNLAFSKEGRPPIAVVHGKPMSFGDLKRKVQRAELENRLRGANRDRVAPREAGSQTDGSSDKGERGEDGCVAEGDGSVSGRSRFADTAMAGRRARRGHRDHEAALPAIRVVDCSDGDRLLSALAAFQESNQSEVPRHSSQFRKSKTLLSLTAPSKSRMEEQHKSDWKEDFKIAMCRATRGSHQSTEVLNGMGLTMETKDSLSE